MDRHPRVLEILNVTDLEDKSHPEKKTLIDAGLFVFYQYVQDEEIS